MKAFLTIEIRKDELPPGPPLPSEGVWALALKAGGPAEAIRGHLAVHLMQSTRSHGGSQNHLEPWEGESMLRSWLGYRRRGALVTQGAQPLVQEEYDREAVPLVAEFLG